MSTMKVTFVGLGNMGYPMAGHLAKAGHEVTVFNRTTSKAEAWVDEYGGAMASTPAAAARGAAVVFACVGNDDDLRSVVFGEQGILAGMDEGAIFVDHSTVSAGVERDIADKAADKGVAVLDAPVSGGQEGARNGVLTIMVGGEEETFAKAEPVIQAFARAVTLMGPLGSGQLTKMVNQICCVGIEQGLAEGLDFAMRAGLDAKKVVEVLSKGAAQSWQMDNRAVSMIEDRFDFGFAIDWMHKDLCIVLGEASKNGAELPVTTRIEGFYARLKERGEGRLDNSALIRLLRQP